MQIIRSTLFLLILASLCLTGCASKKPPIKHPEVVRSAELTHLSQNLENIGARVLQTGQTMRILLSSDRIFNPHSANLTAVGMHTLDILAQMMKIVETTSVEVSAYTDVEAAQLQNMALSNGQAQRVADYLWSKGVDARLLYSVGHGSLNRTSPGMSGSFTNNANRRVEVNFQYLPLLSSLVN